MKRSFLFDQRIAESFPMRNDKNASTTLCKCGAGAEGVACSHRQNRSLGCLASLQCKAISSKNGIREIRSAALRNIVNLFCRWALKEETLLVLRFCDVFLTPARHFARNLQSNRPICPFSVRLANTSFANAKQTGEKRDFLRPQEPSFAMWEWSRFHVCEISEKYTLMLSTTKLSP